MDDMSGGGMPIAGGMDIGGDIGHREMYHTLLNMPPSHWEAIRETAHQMMGGTPSKMWHDDAGGALSAGPAEDDGGGYGLEDLRDIVLTPNPQAAARLIELEHDAGGGSFLKSIKSTAKNAGKHIASLGKAKTWDKIYSTGKSAISTGKDIADVVSGIGGPIGSYGQAASNVLGKAKDVANKYEPLAHKTGQTVENAVNAAKDIKEDPKGAIHNVINIAKDPEQRNAAISGAKDLIGHLKGNADISSKVDKTLDAVNSISSSVKNNNNKDENDMSEKVMEAPANNATDAAAAGGGLKKKRGKKAGGKISKAQVGKMQEGKRQKKRKEKSFGGMKNDMPMPDGGGMDIGGGMPIAGGMRIGGKICRDPRKRF